MPTQWYFEHDGKPQGPFLLSQLKKLAALGRLRPTDLVWQEDQMQRIPASQLKGIFSNSPPLPKTQSRSSAIPPLLPTPPNGPPPLPEDANLPHGMRTPDLPIHGDSSRPTFWQRHGFKMGMGAVGAIILFLAALASSSAEFQEGFAEVPERTTKPQVRDDSLQQTVIARKMTKKQFLENRNHKEEGLGHSSKTITIEFLPHKAGSTAEYHISIPGVGIAEHIWSFNSDGMINDLTKRIGGRSLRSYSTSPDKRVVRDEYVGVIAGGEYGGQFVTCLKLGARLGDSWEVDDAKYSVQEFGTFVSKYDGKTRTTVSIRQELPPLPNGKIIALTSVYAEGVGLIRKDGETPAGPTRWELIEPESSMNLTREERAFYE
ncbi:DUF4339 domain-containing protein [Planctomicrobium sp. SH527]|uniref:DUF4339 domain-containing protein n=1 Tax=Planctomicrobium sp. SH527 TaxID=3448123 RepID=UPI003F5C810D